MSMKQALAAQSKNPLSNGLGFERGNSLFETLCLWAIRLLPLQYAFTLRLGDSPVKISEVLFIAAWLAVPFSKIARRPANGRFFGLGMAILLVLSTLVWLLAGPSKFSQGLRGYDRGLTSDMLFYAAFGIFALLIWWSVRRLPREQLEKALVFSAWICGICVLIQHLGALSGATDVLASMGFRVGDPGALELSSVETRGGPFFEGHQLGFYSGALLLVCLQRRAWIPAAIAVTCGLYSQSTTVLVGLTVAFICVLALKSSTRTFIAFASLSFVGAAATFGSDTVREFVFKQLAKLSLVSSDNQYATLSLDLRSLKSEVGFEIMADFPVLGVGPGRYGAWFFDYVSLGELPSYYARVGHRPIAENVYAQVASEMGVLALLLLVALVAVLMLRNFRLGRIPFALAIFTAMSLWTQSTWTFSPVLVLLALLSLPYSSESAGRVAR